MSSKFRRPRPKPAQNNVPLTGVSKPLLSRARKTGVLNLSSREISEVPSEVWRLNLDASKDARDTGSFASEENWWDQVELTKLIMASNTISSLSDDIANFQALAVLDVHDNKLTSLPTAIDQCQQLERVDLSHNALSEVPLGLCKLQNLRSLKLQHNQISKLPEGIGNLCNIEALEMSHNKLQKLPDSIGNMESLRKIDVSYNSLESLPAVLSSVKSLSILDAQNNMIKDISSEFSCPEVVQIFLTNNRIGIFPNFSTCEKLKELYLGNNQLKGVNIKNLPIGIKILELCDNKIPVISEDVALLKSLERLNIANNDVSTLPARLGAMENIKAVVLDGNPLKAIRRDIISKGTQEILRYLRSRISDEDIVDESGTGGGIGEPESSIHNIKTSKSINLSRKMLSKEKIDENFYEAKELQVNLINLSENNLQSVPEGLIFFAQSLQTLNLAKNKLTSISPAMALTTLTHLDVSGNLLSNLPDEIVQLENLLELNISVNRFTVVPPCVGKLSSLEHLLASGNSITEIRPDELISLEKLSTLALQNNSIARVPPEIVRLPNLKNLLLEGNLFKIPRQSILQQGPAAVIDYLRNRLPA